MQAMDIITNKSTVLITARNVFEDQDFNNKNRTPDMILLFLLRLLKPSKTLFQMFNYQRSW